MDELIPDKKMKSIFLTNMGHEIKTPINSIIGFAELAQYEDNPSKTREYLSSISENAKWLLYIINDILDVSRIEAGKVELEYIPFDLSEIFTQCRSLIAPRAEEKGIMLFYYDEPSIGKKLLGDPARLRQALMNLLYNAVKFTNTGTVKILASVIKSDNKKITIYFEVKDTGLGMSPSQITRVLELSVTKNIVALMGGTLSVESRPGTGSTFSFKLTFDIVDDVTFVPSGRIVINDFERPNFEGEILICEDNSLNQFVICEHLARVGIKTVVAQNGKEGVDIISERVKNGKKQFDLIFMDINMPVMDGLEAASRITDLKVKTPIIALTANIMSHDLELYKASGMFDFLGKPVTSQGLWKCLVQYLPVRSYTAMNKYHQSAEDEKTKEQLKVIFVKENQTTYAEITSALDAGDIKLAHRLAHALKNNAGQIDKKQLQSIAARVEAILSDGENLLNQELLSALETELKSILNELALLLEKKEEPKKLIALDAEKTLELFEKLEPLLKNRDTKSLQLLDLIRAVPGTEELAYQIEGFNFKQAAEMLESLKRDRNS